ncbi:MAG: DNA-binding protein [Clostridia bacterium]|nr:DNA-binding protein [Clostridia bacterium]
MKDTIIAAEKGTYTVEEIQTILGIGRNAAYELIKMDYFKVIRLGRTIRITKKSFDAWFDE